MNCTLVRKLELMHNFTTEAVRLLKSEDELKTSSSAEADSSQQYLFRALEENHEELRRLLLKRLKPRPQRNSVVSAATALGKDYYIDGRNTQLISFEKMSTGGGKKVPQITPWGWIFWTMIFYHLKKFTSRSI